ncbi:MAG TPA: hypothetical protein VHO24_11875 [Opitutaceae bacterium]|nr:hypothetical protein [Opitutaceae bacterium]
MITKFISPRFISLAALGAAVALAGCSKQTRSDASAAASGAYNDTKAAMSNAWDDVKGYTFDKKNDFEASAKAMASKMDAQVSEVRANYSEAKASATRKAAMEELKNSEANYKEKVSALGSATSATWDSAKQNVILAWDRLQASYHKARAD